LRSPGFQLFFAAPIDRETQHNDLIF